MTRIDENLWPVVEPPPGFAERTVERMLAQGNVIALEPVRRYRGLKMAGLLAAAIFISGAAFGYVARSAYVDAPVSPSALPLSNQRFSSMQQRVVRVSAPTLSPIKVAATRTSAKLVGQETVSPASSASASSTSSPISRVPACQCQRGFADMICDCY